MRFIPRSVHTIIGLVVGVALIFAPGIFGFRDVGGAAVTVPVVIGIFIIISELIASSKYSLVNLVPMRVHIMIDYATGLLLALSPWLFQFADEPANAWVPHVVVGLLIIAYALMTNPDSETGDAPELAS